MFECTVYFNDGIYLQDTIHPNNNMQSSYLRYKILEDLFERLSLSFILKEWQTYCYELYPCQEHLIHKISFKIHDQEYKVEIKEKRKI